MNRTYAETLALVFFFGIGLFNVTKGIDSLRSRTESTFWGWVRIVFGGLLLLMPFVLLFYLRSGRIL